MKVLTQSILGLAVLVAAGHWALPPAAAQSEGSPSFDEIASRATAAREADSLLQAIDLYRQALQLDPNWTEGWWYLGTLFYELDRYAEGSDAFRRLVSLDPEGGAGWALLGLCEFQVRDYARALDSLQRARLLKLAGNRELQYVTDYHAALLLNRFENHEVAWEILFQLARQNPFNPRLVEALGLCSLRLPYLPSELPPDKRDAVLRAGRAGAHIAGYRIDDAQREYEMLVERYPDTPNVNYAYGVYLLQGDPDAAVGYFKRELEISPSHVPARLQIVFEYIKRGDPASILHYAEEAVRLAPWSFPARNALGRVYLDTDRVEPAIEQLEKGVALAPESPEMRFALARAYARAGRREDAERERAEFTRLDRIRRTHREGSQAVGGLVPPQ